MSFTKSTTDISVHQKLGDYPNVDDGLSAEELKKRFDLPAETLQKDINTLINELESILSASNLGANVLDENDTSEGNVQAKLKKIYGELQNVALGQIPNGTITEEKIEETFNNLLAKKNGEVQENLNAEMISGRSITDITNSLNVIAGNYTGDSTKQRTIDLGFKPIAVFVMQRNILDESANQYTARHMGFATRNVPYSHSESTILSITETGFELSVNSYGATGFLLNISGRVYNYVAFKKGDVAL